MRETNKVVVHYLDGRISKGTTQDFLPNRPVFHLLSREGGEAATVLHKQLKAVYFVREFGGKPGRKKLKGFIAGPNETAQGKKLTVLFKDGEVLCGYTLSYTPGRIGFFVFPADEGSNNLRVYVVTSATAQVKAGPAADVLARKLLGKRKAA